MSMLLLKDIIHLDLIEEAKKGNKYYIDCPLCASSSGRLEIISVNPDFSIIVLRANTNHSNTYYESKNSNVFLNEPINPQAKDILNALEDIICNSKEGKTKLKI